MTPEAELLAYAERLGRQGFAGRTALHVQFSMLHSMYQKQDYLGIAIGIFADQIAHFGGRYYRLRNDDVVYVAREASGDDLDRVCSRLRLLFSEDPAVTASLESAQAFYVRLDLDSAYGPFLALCKSLAQAADDRQREAALFAQMVVRPDTYPVTPASLGKLEDQLGLVDIGAILRKQTVCALSRGQQPEAVFDETFTSIADLCTLTGMQLNLFANRWLFQYLTQVLDRHVLGHLARAAMTHERPFSLNLNVGTILTPEFQRFNDSVAPRMRHTLVIEFNKLDVFADMGAFLFVRDYLRERGYRLCLDGLNHMTMPYYDRNRLGFDLVKLQWSPYHLGGGHGDMTAAMQRLVRETNQARVILCHCDSPLAIQAGQDLGIFMFQGREVDRMLLQRKA